MLARTLPLLLVALALGFALGRLGGGRSLAAPGPVPDGALPRPAPRAEPEVRLVEPERARPAPAPQPAERLAVAEEEQPAPPPARRAAGSPDDLFLELAALFADDEQTRGSLVEMLVKGHLRRGDPLAALDALERHGSDDAGSYRRVGAALRKAGEYEAADRAFLTLLERNPADRAAAAALAQRDPAAAIAAIRTALASGRPVDRRGSKTSLAELYAAGGNAAEARRLVEELLVFGPQDERALDLLRALDPVAVELRYRQLAADPEHGRRWNQRLANLLVDQGRAEDAADLLEARLRAVPGDEALRGAFISVAPRRAYDYLLATLPVGADDEHAHDLWGYVGDELFERGDRERALEAWRRAVLAVEDPDTWSGHLDEHFPEHTLPVLEERVRLRPEAESWGSLADAYWRAGRASEAADAWRHASALDPDEDEWPAKLTAAERGEDPLLY